MEYLEETLISVLNQSIFEDIEVIMIDDGSTDDSGDIAEKYALDYENFHVYHKKNEGQGIARNYGLSLAEGEYVIFLDSDDYVPPKAYETLYNLAIRNESDIVCGNVLRFALFNVWEDNLFRHAFKDVSEVINKTTLNDMPSLLWDTVTWNKLYKTDFLKKNNIEFPDKKISFQDIPFSLKAYICADSISITPEVCYYWRLRSNNTSVTQQDKNVRNFKDRLEITRLSFDLLEKYEIGNDLKDYLFVKWMDHDLKFNLKRIKEFPEKYYNELLDETYELSKLIPRALIDSQNSYKRVLFTMIQDKEFDDVVKFAPLENELYMNPHIPHFINEKYLKCFDFNRDIENEDLLIELKDVSHDNEDLIIEFDEILYYLSDDVDFNIFAKIIDDGREYDADVNEKRIIIPLKEIIDKNHFKIKVIYQFDKFEKEAYIKNRQRRSISFDAYDIDLNIGVNSYLFVDVMRKKDNEIEISNVSFDSNDFVFEGKSKNMVKEIFIENIITFDRISYPLDYFSDSKGFNFTIPYDTILNEAVKKWELNCPDCLNSIKLSKDFEFSTTNYQIRFFNIRNKIFIDNEIISLAKDNKRGPGRKGLLNRIKGFVSRKVIKK